MQFGRSRGIVISGVLAASLATVVGTASAEPVLASQLVFSPSDPTYDPYGQGTTINGDVTVTDDGWLDFSGRSVVETPDRPNLNPGTSAFTFGARIALTRGVGDWNVMQKANWSDQQWKLSLHAASNAARLSCRFSGSAGAVHVFTDTPVVPADGSWHQVACERVGNTVRVLVDGAVAAQGSGPIGSISSTKPYLIGSKGVGNISDPDQFLGLLDDAFVSSDEDGGVIDPPPALGSTATAIAETDPVAHSGDAADDPAIWPHPTDPSQSAIIGNDKGGALDVYDLQGNLLQRISDGAFGNVDVRTGVTTGTVTRDIVATYRGGLRLYTIDPSTRQLSNITDASTGSISVPTGGEGLCLYRSQQSGFTYAFVVSRAGSVAQYRLTDGDSDGLVDASRVRLWSMGTESEGCVADDELGRFYISEEDVAIWRYGAEPTEGTTSGDRVAVDRVTSAGGHLAPDIEGLTIAQTGSGTGYLLASAQAASDTANYYAVYDRGGSNDFIRTFSVVNGTVADGCGRTDGITAYAGDLGPTLPQGAFVCQDNSNTTPGSVGNQNFKIVPLEQVVELGPDVNDPPNASIKAPTCVQLSCAFDASASSDPENEPLTFTWDFGDGAEADGALATHAYSESGTYTVVVEVRDPLGAASVASTTVEISDAPAPALAFRDVSGASTNATAISPRVPSTVQTSDALLLYVTANRSDATLQAPAGWQSLGRRTDESMQSQLWWRVAQPGDASATVRVTSTAGAKMTAHVIAYSGTNATQPIAAALSAAEAKKSASHTTPVAMTAPTSWVVSLWSNKSSNTTAWSPSPLVTVRQFQGTSGSGRVTSLVADSGAPVGATSSGGFTSVASQSGTMATMWTVVLNPA
ncbi:MAG TPA: phytase [Actinomycetes bacterium]|nr:phytase [Actinomycetes bacterium]